MNPFLAAAFLLLFVAPAWAVPETEVVIVGEMTSTGHKVVHPDRQHPEYYLPIMTGFSDMGASLIKGQLPPSEYDVAHEVAVALSHEGYLYARPGFRVNEKNEVTYADGTVVRVPPYPLLNRPIVFNDLGDPPLTLSMIEAERGAYSMHHAGEIGPRGARSALVQLLSSVDPIHGQVIQNLPSLVLTIQWGTMHPQDIAHIPEFASPGRPQGNVSSNGGPPSPEISVGGNLPDFNEGMLRDLVAGQTWDSLAEWQKSDLMARTADDRYFVVVGAYDFQSCLTGHTKILLWSAKMSVKVNPTAKFGDMLALLIKAGEDHLGRETSRPEFKEVPLVQEGRVIVGTPKVVGDHEDSPNPFTATPEKSGP